MTALSTPHVSPRPFHTAIVAALFDVDNTLLPGQASEVRFFRYLWRRGWSVGVSCGKVGMAAPPRASPLAASTAGTEGVSGWKRTVP